MKKKIKTIIKLQAVAGKATPAPPIGTALGPVGVNIAGFCKDFNAKTQKQIGDIVPVVITVYDDRTYSFIVKSSPAAVLIKKVLNLSKGSSVPNRDKVGKLTVKQVEEIAKIKMADLNSDDLEKAKKIIAGSARSMGVTIEG
jgi:large subunit ribosomal protein L11